MLRGFLFVCLFWGSGVMLIGFTIALLLLFVLTLSGEELPPRLFARIWSESSSCSHDCFVNEPLVNMSASWYSLASIHDFIFILIDINSERLQIVSPPTLLNYTSRDQHCRKDDRFFRRGSRVVIAGLTNAAVVENNGAIAEVIRYDMDLAMYVMGYSVHTAVLTARAGFQRSLNLVYIKFNF